MRTRCPRVCLCVFYAVVGSVGAAAVPRIAAQDVCWGGPGPCCRVALRLPPRYNPPDLQQCPVLSPSPPPHHHHHHSLQSSCPCRSRAPSYVRWEGGLHHLCPRAQRAPRPLPPTRPPPPMHPFFLQCPSAHVPLTRSLLLRFRRRPSPRSPHPPPLPLGVWATWCRPCTAALCAGPWAPATAGSASRWVSVCDPFPPSFPVPLLVPPPSSNVVCGHHIAEWVLYLKGAAGCWHSPQDCVVQFSAGPSRRRAR